MSIDIDQLIQRLDSAAYDPGVRYDSQLPSLAETLKEIRFHAKTRYWQFAPTYGGDFETRLASWLNNPGLNAEDQEAMLRLVPELQFLDRDDMLTLYRTAFTNQISRWLMDQLELGFSGREADRRRAMGAALRRTWFCPVTDSMDIGQFCRVNRVSPMAYRPQWYALQKFALVEKIREFIDQKRIERVVLLEDFVGSGNQVRAVLQFATDQATPFLPVLFVPLVISEIGLQQLRPLCDAANRLEVRPTCVIPKSVHVRRTPESDEPNFVSSIRPVILTTSAKFRMNAFGYRGVGTLVVSHANCPNNSPPLLWTQNDTWAGLFPRVSRPGS